jgi:hypothetical protein
VEYDLVVNATSQQEAQEVVDAIQQQINTGMIGDYSVDPNYPINAKFTMQSMEKIRFECSKLALFLCFIIIWLGILCEILKLRIFFFIPVPGKTGIHSTTDPSIKCK